MAMASIIPDPHLGAPCTLLAMPPEIRQHIFQFCIPQNQCIDFSYDGRHYPKMHNNLSWEREAALEADAQEMHHIKPSGLDDHVYKLQTLRIRWLFPYDRAAPRVLLLCRQITNEVKPMLYGGNTFVFPHRSRQLGGLMDGFSPETKKLVRKIILFVLPNDYDLILGQMHPHNWDDILSNLRLLGVIIERPSPLLYHMPRLSALGYPDLPQWTTALTMTIQYLARALPTTAKLVVDTNEEEPTAQIVKTEFPGRCVFQRLRPGDYVHKRGEFVRKPQ
ncbi:hypothetical protein ACHAPT_010920 [Fusarium lateritium]